MTSATSSTDSVSETIPVLCCCDPNNLLGHAPAGLELTTREWEEVGGEDVDYELIRGTAYVGEQLELSEWLDLPGFEPEPEIHLRRALERVESVLEGIERHIETPQDLLVERRELYAAREQIELARKPKGRPKPKPRTWKEGKK